VPSQSETLRSIGFLVSALVLFAVMDVLIKLLSTDYGTFQIVFFRSAVALLPISILVARSGGVRAIRTARLGGHILRSLIGTSALLCFFYSYKFMPLADAYAIHFAGPLFLTALSGPMLGEPVGWRRWSAVAVGFVGVVVMIQPGTGVFSAVALIPLLGAVFYAFAMIFVRKLSRTETNAAIIFYFTLTGTGVGFVGMLPDWKTPDATGLALLTSVGILGGCAQILMTQAFRSAPAATLAPFNYTAMIWGVLFGYLVFADFPTPPIIIGALIVVASGLYILHRETRRQPRPVAELTGKATAP
jgi:drug/metabolite transporter (DMT)-like permease